MFVVAVQPILAKIDPEAIFAIVVALISFGSWVVNQINNAKGKNPGLKPPVRRQRPVAPRDEKLFQEINIFLEETQQRSSGQQRRKGKPVLAQRPTAGQSAPMGRQKGSDPKAKASQKPVAVPVAEARQAHRPPGGEIARRKLTGTEKLGSQVREHISEMQKSRVEAKVSQDLRNHIASDVKAALGDSSITATTATTNLSTPASTTLPPQRVADFLRQPAHMRQAFLFSLILSPPRSLHRKSSL